MFIGHYGAAYAAKRLAPKTSLGTLMLAAILLDIIWPVLVLVGVERVSIQPGITRVNPMSFDYYPYSHSLVAACILAGLFASAYFATRRGGLGASIVLGLCVLGHWGLDALVHIPDLPVAFGKVKVGLGLWDSVPGTVIVEGSLLAAGVALYMTSAEAIDRIGSFGSWTLIILLSGIYAAQFFGPAPPDSNAVAIVSLTQVVFVASGYLTDEHRKVAAQSLESQITPR